MDPGLRRGDPVDGTVPLPPKQKEPGPKTRQFIEGLKALGGPPIQEKTPEEARKFLEDAQSQPVTLVPALVETRTIPGGPTGEVRVHIVRPDTPTGLLPVVLDVHGGGWVLGSWHTHERLVRELATRIPAVVVFVDYVPSPDARFPVAIEQGYAVLSWIAAHHQALTGEIMKGDTANAAKTWSAMQAHMNTIADALSDGIAKQFPQKAA